MKVFKKLCFFTIGCIFIVIFCAWVYYLQVTKDVTLKEELICSPHAIISVYDKDDELAFECSVNGKEKIFYNDLNQNTINAVISAEDKCFFKHNGLNYKRMAAAFVKNVRAGAFKEGASTITQQLIKNTHLSDEKKIERKLQEIKLAKQLEKKMDKKDILTAYLNTIYFGHGCFGIKEASEYYFDKNVGDLTVSESAILAGLICSPNNYSPFKAPDKCKNRRDHVLKAMKTEGYINEKEYITALNEPLPQIKLKKVSKKNSYCDLVFEELSEIYPNNVYGKLEIYTYFDVKKQEILEKQKNKREKKLSMIILNTEKNGIEAFYSDVQNAKRQPGSTLKPLLVYAPAMEEGLISPASPLLDTKTSFGDYTPKNFDGKEHGMITARTALKESYNIPTVKLLNTLGVEKAVKYLNKMDLTVEDGDSSLVLALGGMKNGFSLKEICSAYTTFSNGGNYSKARCIRKIIENSKEVYEHKAQFNRVFSNETITLINDILMDAAKTGTAKKLKPLSSTIEICAKTGTAGIDKGNTDAWCISYTDENVIGVWTGRENGDLVQDTGGGLPADINYEIAKTIYKDKKPKSFEKSKNVIMHKIDKNEFYTNGKLVLADDNAPIGAYFKEIFNKKYEPNEKTNDYSSPIIKNVRIDVKYNQVKLLLCHAEYINIIVNRVENNKIRTIYHGKALDEIIDTSTENNKTYVYYITPYYDNFIGKTITLPSVELKSAPSSLKYLA